MLDNWLIDFYNIDNKGEDETYLVSVPCALLIIIFHIIVINIIILILFVNVSYIGLLHNAALGFDIFQAVRVSQVIVMGYISQYQTNFFFLFELGYKHRSSQVKR